MIRAPFTVHTLTLTFLATFIVSCPRQTGISNVPEPASLQAKQCERWIAEDVRRPSPHWEAENSGVLQRLEEMWPKQSITSIDLREAAGDDIIHCQARVALTEERTAPRGVRDLEYSLTVDLLLNEPVPTVKKFSVLLLRMNEESETEEGVEHELFARECVELEGPFEGHVLACSAVKEWDLDRKDEGEEEEEEDYMQECLPEPDHDTCWELFLIGEDGHTLSYQEIECEVMSCAAETEAWDIRVVGVKELGGGVVAVEVDKTHQYVSCTTWESTGTQLFIISSSGLVDAFDVVLTERDNQKECDPDSERIDLYRAKIEYVPRDGMVSDIVIEVLTSEDPNTVGSRRLFRFDESQSTYHIE